MRPLTRTRWPATTAVGAGRRLLSLAAALLLCLAGALPGLGNARAGAAATRADLLAGARITAAYATGGQPLRPLSSDRPEDAAPLERLATALATLQPAQDPAIGDLPVAPPRGRWHLVVRLDGQRELYITYAVRCKQYITGGRSCQAEPNWFLVGGETYYSQAFARYLSEQLPVDMPPVTAEEASRLVPEPLPPPPPQGLQPSLDVQATGLTVQLRLVVRNADGQPLAVTFPVGPAVEFYVCAAAPCESPAAALWHQTAAPVPAAGGQESWPPGEERVWEATWQAPAAGVYLFGATFLGSTAGEEGKPAWRSGGYLTLPEAPPSFWRQYPDLESHWAGRIILQAMLEGWVTAGPGSGVRPDEPVTRGEFRNMLAAALAPGSQAAQDAAGYPPDQPGELHAPLSREEMAEQAARALLEGTGLALIDANPDPGVNLLYADADNIAPARRGFVARLAAAGVMTGGRDGRFRPLAAATRAEAVAVIQRLARLRRLGAFGAGGYVGEPVAPLPPEMAVTGGQGRLFLAADARGELFLSDGAAIWAATPGEPWRRLAATGPVTALAAGNDGTVAYATGPVLWRLGPGAEQPELWAGGDAGYRDGYRPEVQFTGITALAVASEPGSVYVADGAGTLRLVSGEGHTETVAGRVAGDGPWHQGRLQAEALPPGGGEPAGSDGPGPAATLASSAVQHIALRPDGSLYMLDAGRVRVYRPGGGTYLASSGWLWTTGGVAGPAGGAAAEADPVDGGPLSFRLGSVAAIAVDRLGNLWVAEERRKDLRLITPAGHALTLQRAGPFGAAAGQAGAPATPIGVSGDPGATDSGFAQPGGWAALAWAADGYLYGVDAGRTTLWRLTPTGEAAGLGLLATGTGPAGTADAEDDTRVAVLPAPGSWLLGRVTMTFQVPAPPQTLPPRALRLTLDGREVATVQGADMLSFVWDAAATAPGWHRFALWEEGKPAPLAEVPMRASGDLICDRASPAGPTIRSLQPVRVYVDDHRLEYAGARPEWDGCPSLDLSADIFLPLVPTWAALGAEVTEEAPGRLVARFGQEVLVVDAQAGTVQASRAGEPLASPPEPIVPAPRWREGEWLVPAGLFTRWSGIAAAGWSGQGIYFRRRW